mmetsp:Transcript_33139/g.65802  ORF Transcript_33139/g.65802 Transcript_33139/m.65802 type:complete len:99 (-) Transcript_33139:490-786(-)
MEPHRRNPSYWAKAGRCSEERQQIKSPSSFLLSSSSLVKDERENSPPLVGFLKHRPACCHFPSPSVFFLDSSFLSAFFLCFCFWIEERLQKTLRNSKE